MFVHSMYVTMYVCMYVCMYNYTLCIYRIVINVGDVFSVSTDYGNHMSVI